MERSADQHSHPLRDGALLRCPQCEAVRPVGEYRREKRIGRYASQTVELYRCPDARCRHVFGLANGAHG